MKQKKTIVLTGATSDLGGCILRYFSRIDGYNIIATTRQTTESLEKSDHVKWCKNCDLLVDSSINRLKDLVCEDNSTHLSLIHSVGSFWDHPKFEELEPADAKATFDSHVTTLYNVVHGLRDFMIDRPSSVIAFSCNSVIYNYPQMAAFTASKSAVESLVKSLANDFSQYGVRFNAIQLTSLSTPKVLESKPRGDAENYMKPSDIFPALEFLTSEDSKFISGSIIKMFRHSESFFGEGYYKRISK